MIGRRRIAWIGVLAATIAAAASSRGADPIAAAQAAVERAHAELWRRFVDPHDVILDYADFDGSIVRPTPDDCRQLRPSALSWGVPVEDGALLGGLYLDALVNRWNRTGSAADRALARRMIAGLEFLASRGRTPGFIARGVATDGTTTYPMGSNDQTMPWLYGVWRYLHDGVAAADERARLTARFCDLVRVLEGHQWQVPCDGGPAPYRGSFARHTWESAPRLLFVLKAMHGLTGDERWQRMYRQAAEERGGKAQRTRLEICRAGMVFDPGQAPRHSWTGSIGVAALRGLWELETDPALRAVYADGLRASARLAAESLPLFRQFDPHTPAHFEHDWRVMNAAWKPQHSEADAVAVALAGLKVQHRASPRLPLENDYLREPIFAAWIVTLCPDRDVVAQHRDTILALIGHYPFEKVYLSQFFPVESAWYRLQTLGLVEARSINKVSGMRTVRGS